MVSTPYYDPTETGGMFASLGFHFQDLCTLYYLFLYLNREDFSWIAQEQLDDITIGLSSGQIISIQVKRKELTAALLAKYLISLPDTPDAPIYHANAPTEYFKIYAVQSMNDSLKVLRDFRRAYEAALFNQNPQDCERCKTDLEKQVARYHLPFERFLRCDFRLFGDDDFLESFILTQLQLWLSKHHFDTDPFFVLRYLKGRMSELRNHRGSMNRLSEKEILHYLQTTSKPVPFSEQIASPCQTPKSQTAQLSEYHYPDYFWQNLFHYICSDELDASSLKELLDSWADLLQIPYPSSFHRASLNRFAKSVIFREIKPMQQKHSATITQCFEKAIDLNLIPRDCFLDFLKQSSSHLEDFYGN